MADDDAQPQRRRIKYLPPSDYSRLLQAPSRRMSNLRDATSITARPQPYPQRRPTPASIPNPTATSSWIYGGAPASSNRPVLPSLSSTFPNTHSDQHEMLSSSRTVPARSDPFSPSFNPHFWPNNGHSPMADHSYNYNSFDSFDARNNTPTPPQPFRHSPGSAAPQDVHRRAPPISIPSNLPRDDPWSNNYYTSSYPANFALTSAPPDVSAHSPSYPANYGMSFHTGPHQGPTYQPIPPSIDTRHPLQSSHHGHYQAEASMPPHRPGHPADWTHQPQRSETHLVSPYARTHKDTSTSPQDTQPADFPSIKKKRKRADANQLKVLNEVYARTAFPTTEERLDLAKRLDMSARSVQIWFQNKRQSSRSRTTANTVPPMMHHPYVGGSSSASGASHGALPGHGHSGAEVSVSPSAHAHGGSYSVQPSGSGSHRSYRAQSPSNPPPPETVRRVRSPEGSSRMRASSGRP